MKQSEIDRLARKLFIDSFVELWKYSRRSAARRWREDFDGTQDRYRWGIRWAIANIPALKAKAKKREVGEGDSYWAKAFRAERDAICGAKPAKKKRDAHYGDCAYWHDKRMCTCAQHEARMWKPKKKGGKRGKGKK